MDGITIKPHGKRRLCVTFPFSKARIEQIVRIMLTTQLPFPATAIPAAPHKPATTSTPAKPLAAYPPHPFIKLGCIPPDCVVKY